LKNIDIRIQLILCFLLILFIFSSCIGTNKPFEVKVYNKSYYANYGELSSYNEGNIYFEHLSNIYVLDTANNSLTSYIKGKTQGSLFCVENNLLYFIKRKNEKMSISSRDLQGNTIQNILDYKVSGIRIYKYIVEDGTLYSILGEMNFYKDNGFHYTETENLQSFVAPDDFFTLFTDERCIFIRDKMHNVSGMFNMNKNYFTPYNTSYSTILTYNKNSNTAFIHSRGNIYIFNGNTIINLTNLAPENSPLMNVSVFSEDENELYMASNNYVITQKTHIDELFSINKKSGIVKSIYTANSDENILYINPKYIIIYKKGEISKKYLDSEIKDQNLRIYNTDDNSIELECSGNYIFAKRKDTLHIINLDTMKEVTIN
jgi:hypothetical protein